jgi:hypothetical protein
MKLFDLQAAAPPTAPLDLGLEAMEVHGRKGGCTALLKPAGSEPSKDHLVPNPSTYLGTR